MWTVNRSYCMDQNETRKHSILYAADPLCPWCYGFGPVVQKIREEYKDKIRFDLVLGGLRFGDSAEVLTSESARVLKHEWKDAEFITKQPFQLAPLEQKEFRYDSFASCKAVVSAQKIKPEITFDFLNAISKAFFHESRDPNSIETFIAVAETFEIDPNEFRSVYENGDTDLETKNDFFFGFSLGVSAFPTLVFSDGLENGILTRGYYSYEQVDSILKDYFRSVRI